MRKLAEVLKVPMAFFYSDTDDEVAELLLRYGQASRAVRKRVGEVLKGQGVWVVWKAACDPITAVRSFSGYVCDAAIAVAHGLIVSLRTQPYSGQACKEPAARALSFLDPGSRLRDGGA